MFEVIFLAVLATIWLVFATAQDLKKRIVYNWVNFSLIIFALGFRFFYSLFLEGGFWFFYQGLIGLGIFFILGNVLYYGRMFAGGDAKLMIALGTILPFSLDFVVNVKIFIFFLGIFLISGGVYGLGWSVFLLIKNIKIFKTEFPLRFRENKKIIYLSIFSAIILLILGFYEPLLLYLGILLFILPYLYIYGKVIDESCLMKNIETKKLEEGDWLYEDLKIGKQTIKKSWHGLKMGDIKKIRKKFDKIKIKEGIPFVPVFLISFLILIYIYFFNFEFFDVLLERFLFLKEFF